MSAGEVGPADSPVQSAEAEPQGEVEPQEESSGASAELVAPQAQIEAISSGTERKFKRDELDSELESILLTRLCVVAGGTLSLGGGTDDGDDSIVPSTPTLYVPRRNDG